MYYENPLLPPILLEVNEVLEIFYLFPPKKMEDLVKVRLGNNMHKILRFVKTAYITSQNLKPLLRDYTNPDDFISRMVKSKELIRLKKGFFIITEKIENNLVPYEQIANLLYGPSYISLEWALSYYKMIPEGVYVVTSVVSNKSKIFTTQLGTFDYYYLNHKSYSIGIDQQENNAGRFLIATPEKALADLVFFKSKKISGKELIVDLIENKRIDEIFLKKMNKKYLLEIARAYRSSAVNNLVNVLGIL